MDSRYNSAVFASQSVTDYSVVLGTKSFLDGAAFNTTPSDSINLPLSGDGYVADLQILAKTHQLDNLTNAECVQAFDLQFNADYQNVVLITSDLNPNSSIIRIWQSDYTDTGVGWKPWDWMCVDRFLEYRNDKSNCSSGYTPKDPNYWIFNEHRVDYCLAQKSEGICTLSFSLGIMIGVIICNLVKAICMGITLWKLHTPTLVTIGDAVASFLDEPDRTTVGLCVVSNNDVKEGAWNLPRPRPWVPERRRWFEAVSRRRGIATSLL
jgi:hypothetical protein